MLLLLWLTFGLESSSLMDSRGQQDTTMASEQFELATSWLLFDQQQSPGEREERVSFSSEGDFEWRLVGQPGELASNQLEPARGQVLSKSNGSISRQRRLARNEREYL